MAFKKNSITSQFIINTIFIVICLLTIIPLITVVSISISSDSSIMENGYSILPHDISFEAYQYVFEDPNMILRSYMVSIFVTFIGCFLNMLISSMFAYSLSRRDFKLSKLFTFLVVFTMLFNGGLVTNYMVVVNILKLSDNIFALILPYSVIPIYVLILRTFFSSLPMSIIESAKMDGANEFYIFLRIVIPISKPVLASVGVLVLMLYWNDWFLGLLYINNPKIVPIQLMLNRIMQNIELLKDSFASLPRNVKFPAESARMAMCVLAAGPMLLIFPFFQKYFTKGLTIGSLKG